MACAGPDITSSPRVVKGGDKLLNVAAGGGLNDVFLSQRVILVAQHTHKKKEVNVRLKQSLGHRSFGGER